MTLRDQVIAEITKKSDRDKQRRVGPSEIGNPCDRCLGRALMDERVEQDFSLYPWIGTAVHFFLEENTFKDCEHELKLYVGDVEGYGPIKGTTDMVWIDEDGKLVVVDWKIVGNKKLKSYRANGVSKMYRYQAMTYGKGLELQGRTPDRVAIVFIPRDSGNVRDIWVYEEAYNPEMADAARTRAGLIYAWLQEDGHKWQDLESDFDCFVCNNMW